MDRHGLAVAKTLPRVSRQFHQSNPTSTLVPWDDKERHEFLVRITIRSDRVDLEVFDDGRQFDPLSVSAPDPVPPLQRPRLGGLGIHMVKKLVDRFTYERMSGRNHITLSKLCNFGTPINGGDK